MAGVVVLLARKGGAGKSTLAATLATASPFGAFHIGTVDLDSQANLSRWALGRDVVSELGALQSVAALEYPPAGLLREDFVDLKRVGTREELVEIVRSRCIHSVDHIRGLSIIPTAPHIHAETARELVVSRLPFGAVIVDTPPDISTPAVRSVLSQADVVISPVIPEPWAVDSMEAVAREIRLAGRSDLLDDSRVRFVVNQRQKTALHDKLEKNMRESWGALVSRTVIPRTVAIAEASLDPRVLTPKHPLSKIGKTLWSEITRVMTKKETA